MPTRAKQRAHTGDHPNPKTPTPLTLNPKPKSSFHRDFNEVRRGSWILERAGSGFAVE